MYIRILITEGGQHLGNNGLPCRGGDAYIQMLVSVLLSSIACHALLYTAAALRAYWTRILPWGVSF